MSQSQLQVRDLFAPLADELGSVKAELKLLKDREKQLEADLKATGRDVIEGDLYRVSISRDVERSSVAWKAVAEHFHPSRQLLTAHTNKSVYDRVNVSAHKK